MHDSNKASVVQPDSVGAETCLVRCQCGGIRASKLVAYLCGAVNFAHTGKKRGGRRLSSYRANTRQEVAVHNLHHEWGQRKNEKSIKEEPSMA